MCMQAQRKPLEPEELHLGLENRHPRGSTIKKGRSRAVGKVASGVG